MKVSIIPVTKFQQNCSVLQCEQTGRGAVVDPGGDLDQIRAVLREENVELEKILVTHAHIDHAGGVAELARSMQVPIEGPHPEDKFWIDALADQGRMFGFPPSEPFTPARWLGQGNEVRFVPGHGPTSTFGAERRSNPFVGDAVTGLR